MFHTGTANPSNKFSAQQMYEELVRCAQIGELDENDIPKTSTIQNWISSFSRKWNFIRYDFWHLKFYHVNFDVTA